MAAIEANVVAMCAMDSRNAMLRAVCCARVELPDVCHNQFA